MFMCMSMYMCVHAQVYVNIHVHVCMNVSVHMHVYVNMLVCVVVNVCAWACMSVLKHVHVWASIYMCLCMCVHVQEWVLLRVGLSEDIRESIFTYNNYEKKHYQPISIIFINWVTGYLLGLHIMKMVKVSHAWIW